MTPDTRTQHPKHRNSRNGRDTHGRLPRSRAATLTGILVLGAFCLLPAARAFAGPIHVDITSPGTGHGRVISAAGGPGTIDCEGPPNQGTCEGNFQSFLGEVTLEATASTGSALVAWSGVTCGQGTQTSAQCTFPAPGFLGATATAEFEAAGPTEFPLTIGSVGSGTGTVGCEVESSGTLEPCEADYAEGTHLKLLAVPDAGSEFLQWSGDCSGAGACEVTMDEARSVTATFKLEGVVEFPLALFTSGSGTGTVECEAAGGGPEPCEPEYAGGTDLTLVPVAGSHSEFAGFSAGTGSASGCAGIGPCTFTVEADSSVTATFNLERRQLTVTTGGTGTGTVTSSPAGINCGSSCAAAYDFGTTVTLSGSPGANTQAVVWSGCDVVTGFNQCRVSMMAAKNVTATFNLEKHQLTVTKGGTGSGTVTSSPAGIDCGSTCSAEYEQGTAIILSGTPDAHSEAVVWSGCDTVSPANECEVSMAAAKNVTATFNLEQLELTVTKGGTGSGTVTSSPAGINCGTSCASAYDFGTTVTLSGSPGANTQAVVWSGCDVVTGFNQCRVSMTAAKSVTATFNLDRRPLTIVKGGTGTGTVTSSPAGIDCGSTCSAEYERGTAIVLSGAPGPHSEAVIWSGCDAVSPANECEVSMSAAKSVTATFTLERRQLTVVKGGTGTGRAASAPAGISCGPTCDGEYDYGTLVTLAATPTPGSHSLPVSWSGCDVVNANGECEVTMTAAKSVNASFDLEPLSLTISLIGSGTGTVTSSPAGIDCGTSCSLSRDYGTKVMLTATPAPGSEAVGLSGAGCTGAASCVVALDRDLAVVAQFRATEGGSSTAPSLRSRQFSLGAFTPNANGVAATLEFNAPSSGTLVVVGRFLKKVSVRTKSAGKAQLKLRLTRPGRQALRRGSRHRLKVKARITFIPDGGSPTVLARAMVFRMMPVHQMQRRHHARAAHPNIR